VTPATRSSSILTEWGLMAVDMSIAALKGEASLALSLLSSTPPTSTRPRSVGPEMMPAAIHLPRASMRVASAGMTTLAPAATIRPSRNTTVPFSIGAEPSPMASVPPVTATVWAIAGAHVAAVASRAIRACFT